MNLMRRVYILRERNFMQVVPIERLDPAALSVP